MSSQEEILNNFISYITHVTNSYRNIYDINNTIITEQLPQTFMNYANNNLTNVDIENFTSEQIQRQQRIISHVIILFQTLLEDDDLFTDDEKNRFTNVLDLYNEKKRELDILNQNPRTGGKKSRKGKKSKKSKKSRKNRKSKKRV